MTALGQAKLSYVADALRLCAKHRTVAFVSIIPNDIVRPDYDFLRKDYAFLFERFFHFLNGQPDNPKPMGTVIFDEIEKTQSQILIKQMEKYFLHSTKGKTRSLLIVPEPLFVHSDLTIMIQMADLVAYIVSWGVRLTDGTRPMTKPRREELDSLARQVCGLRYHAKTPGGHDTWGFTTIGELKACGGPRRRYKMQPAYPITQASMPALIVLLEGRSDAAQNTSIYHAHVGFDPTLMQAACQTTTSLGVTRSSRFSILPTSPVGRRRSVWQSISAIRSGCNSDGCGWRLARSAP